MSNERADEFLSWRGRLGQPDALPEQGLDNPEASWQRLNARMHGAGQRRPVRYMVAAALLLLLAVPATLLYRGTRPAVGNGQPAGSIKNRFPASEVKAAVVIKDAGTIKDAGAGTRTAGAGGSRDRRVAERRVMTMPEQRQVALVTMPPATTPPKISDSGARLAVLTKPVRKPLRVVSINEIDHPGITGPAMTAQWPATHFRITLNPRSNALPPETALQERGSTLLKIKLTP